MVHRTLITIGFLKVPLFIVELQIIIYSTLAGRQIELFRQFYSTFPIANTVYSRGPLFTVELPIITPNPGKAKRTEINLLYLIMNIMKQITFKNTIANKIILVFLIAISLLIIGYLCGKGFYYLSH
jgi:hypothetical protein